MSVRWGARFALLLPPSASTLKAAMSASAQKATKEMGFTVLVRELGCPGTGWGQDLENHKKL